MSEIKVPVSAPGAVEAAENLLKMVKALSQVTEEHKKVTAEEEKSEKMRRSMDQAITKRAKFFEQTATQSRQLRSAEAREIMEQNKRNQQGAGSLSKRAERKLLNMIPGGNIIDDIGDITGGVKGGGGIAASFGVLSVALLAGAAAFRGNTLAVERANAAMLENMKINNDLNRQAKDMLDKRQSEAAKEFGSIRKAAKTILNTQGAQGAQDVEELMRFGGPDAVNTMAELLKKRRKSLKNVSASGITSDVLEIQSKTGEDFNDILKAFAEQKGRYDPKKIKKEMMGWMSEEMFNVVAGSGAETDLSDTIGRYEAVQARSRKVSASRTLNKSLVMGGMMSELQDLIDPMKKVVDAHNAKINEEIAMREAVIGAQKSYVDFWIDHLGPISDAMKAAGIETAAGKATREKKALNAGKR